MNESTVRVESSVRSAGSDKRIWFQVLLMVAGGASIGWAFGNLVELSLGSFAAHRFGESTIRGVPMARQLGLVLVQATFGVWMFHVGYRARVHGRGASPLSLLFGALLIWALLLVVVL